MPFTQHLEELRRRLIICFVAVGIGFVISYFFAEQLFEILMRPLLKVMPEEGRLIYTGLHEAFVTYLKVAFLAGVGLASPVIIYQLWRFIAPGLYERERSALLPIVFFSSFFFIGGALFGYFVVFPYGFKFFLGFTTEHIEAMPRVREYLSFAAKILFAFGVVFEMPLFTFFLAKLGIVDAQMLRRKQKYSLLLIFTFAALLTPPDVVTQLMMAGPLLVLYEISILVARIFGRKPAAEPQEEASAKSS
jgi:sec-independent protein translocase protein TatC